MARGRVSGETIVCESGASRFRTGWRVVGGERWVASIEWWDVGGYGRYFCKRRGTRRSISRLARGRATVAGWP